MPVEYSRRYGRSSMLEHTLNTSAPRAFRLLFVAALLAGLGLAGMPVRTARAATFDVDRTDDNAAATACTGAANDCSLRGAIAAANALAGADDIILPAGTYTLT